MIKRALTGIGLLVWIWLFAGCAEVVVPGTLAGGGEVYRYTTGNIAKRTFVSNVDQITKATRRALRKMNIHYLSTSTRVSETEMKAETEELDITISMTPITAATTRVDVDAVKESVFKDKATAAEILYQIELELKQNTSADNDFPRVFAKNECHPVRSISWFTIWTAIMDRRSGKPGAGSVWSPGKKSTSPIPTTGIFIFTERHSPSINGSGPAICHSGSKASAITFSRWIWARNWWILPRASAATNVELRLSL